MENNYMKLYETEQQKNKSSTSLEELMLNKEKKLEKKDSERKHGGQVGHQGYYRDRLEADEIITLGLENASCECGGEFCIDSNPHIHQTVDIPSIKPHVTNYQLNCYRCNQCGRRKKAKLPYGVSNEYLLIIISVQSYHPSQFL